MEYGWQEVLLPINQPFQFLKKQIHLEQMSPVETMSSVKNSSILEIPQFFFGLVVVAMVILIIFVIGGLAEWTWVWLAASTSDYRGAITACSV